MLSSAEYLHAPHVFHRSQQREAEAKAAEARAAKEKEQRAAEAKAAKERAEAERQVGAGCAAGVWCGLLIPRAPPLLSLPCTLHSPVPPQFCT